MLEFINKLWVKYKDIIVYLFFGVLTTLVNYAVYLPLYNYLYWSATVSNIAAWCVAVIFAFITNKQWVFKSCDWSIRTTFPELIKFIGCRVGSGLIETALLFVLVDLILLNGNLIKLILSVAVVIFNYIASKLFVFKEE